MSYLPPHGAFAPPPPPSYVQQPYPQQQQGYYAPAGTTQTGTAARKGSAVMTNLTPQAQSNPTRKNSRIDPRQVPRPVTYLPPEKDKPEPDNANLTFYTKSGQIPPTPFLEFRVVDEGNCSPKFMRLTCWQVPHSKELAEEAHINVALIVQPLATSMFDQELPVIELPTTGSTSNDNSFSEPIRCGRCAAYMNCFNTFPKEDKGRTFKCALCSKVNDLPSHYVCNLDEYGLRRDRFERPELCYGSYEMMVHSSPAHEPTVSCDLLAVQLIFFKVPSFLFLIDVSYGSIVTGFLESTIHSILSVLPLIAEKYPKGRVGIISYDSNIHFYALGVRTFLFLGVLSLNHSQNLRKLRCI
jgi:protein transport protein SEC24